MFKNSVGKRKGCWFRKPVYAGEVKIGHVPRHGGILSPPPFTLYNMIVSFYPRKTKCFRGILESSCLSVRLCAHL